MDHFWRAVTVALLFICAFAISAQLGYLPSPLAAKIDAHVDQGRIATGASQLTCYNTAATARRLGVNTDPDKCFDERTLEEPRRYVTPGIR